MAREERILRRAFQGNLRVIIKGNGAARILRSGTTGFSDEFCQLLRGDTLCRDASKMKQPEGNFS